jgi:hypothetical protein
VGAGCCGGKELHCLTLHASADALLERADAGHRGQAVLGRRDHLGEPLRDARRVMPVRSLRRIKNEIAKWGKVVRAAKIMIE